MPKHSYGAWESPRTTKCERFHVRLALSYDSCLLQTETIEFKFSANETSVQEVFKFRRVSKKHTEERGSLSITPCDNLCSFSQRTTAAACIPATQPNKQKRGLPPGQLPHKSSYSLHFCGFSTSTDCRCQQGERVKAENYLQHVSPVQ